MSAASAEPYRYTIQFPSPITHYAEVTARFPNPALGPLELFLAVWTPGSYLIREYARHLEAVCAFDTAGNPLTIRKTRKNRWRVESTGCYAIRVEYRVYCHDLSVRTNWVDDRFALLHGAATYLSIPGALDHVHDVTLVLPTTWKTSVSGLSGHNHHYTAPDYDTLVDSPILAGNPSIYEFEVAGKPHVLVNEGEGDPSIWDGTRSIAGIAKIVEEHIRLWGSLPYDRYVFLNILIEGPGGGGLEHKNSFCIVASRYATRTRATYTKWLELVSHEFFHVWNVKRLRPIELGPFDYENENYTRGLWIAEGFTEYYSALMLVRAGLINRDEYLARLTALIEALQTTPGRLVKPAEEASFDAWIKAYRPDENSVNTTISYYTKGAVIAFLLDAKMRAEGNGQSLDHILRALYAQYSGEEGFPHNVLSGDWWQTTDELDYAPALEFFGLRFQTPKPNKTRSELGFTTKTDNGRLIVATVPRGTPAFVAGFSADDEILGLNGYRVLPDQWSTRMEQFHPGESISVLVSRRGKLAHVDATLAPEPVRCWVLEADPAATEKQKHQLSAWLEPLPRP